METPPNMIPDQTTNPFATLSVLYVEDNPESRDVLRLLFRTRLKPAHLIVFDDSENFVERVAALQPRPTLILLDIHVKPLSGFQMLEILRGQPEFRDTPIVALTASVMNEEVQQLQTAGFHSVISKPISLSTFPDLMKRIIAGENIWRIID